MKPQLLASSTVTTILFIILIFINKTSYGVDDDKFTQCKRGYGCGFIKDVRYPFWGDGTPSYCGRPGFKLSCLADGFPAINYGTLRLGVQEINHTGQMMRLMRNDLWGSSCPETLYNTTLDYSLFDYAQTTGALYGNESFFRLNGLLNYTSSCSVSIQVPVFQTNLDSIVDGRVTDGLSLRDALYRGFDVIYSFPESNNCSTCEASGGVCGSNSTLLGFVCFCSNGTYLLQCPTARGGEGSCRPTGCITDVNKQCPTELQFRAGKACKTACQTFGRSEYYIAA